MSQPNWKKFGKKPTAILEAISIKLDRMEEPWRNLRSEKSTVKAITFYRQPSQEQLNFKRPMF